jgi:hypothetical protein
VRSGRHHNKASTIYQLNTDCGYKKNSTKLFITIHNILDERLVATDIVDLYDYQLALNENRINIFTGIKYYFKSPSLNTKTISA